MNKFSFTILCLILTLFLDLSLAAPPSKPSTAEMTYKQMPVSTSMGNVIIPSMAAPPLDAQGFLAQGAIYGGERKTVAADVILQEAMGWGMGITTVQFPLNKLKSVEYIPGPPADFTNTWNGGAYDMAFTCHKYGQTIVDNLNKQCKNCGKTYALGIFWGTFTGMDFDKDAILSAGCSALEVINSNTCFNDFPKSCAIRAIGQPIELWDNTPTRISINAKSRAQIISAIKKYAADKHQNIAVPPS